MSIPADIHSLVDLLERACQRCPESVAVRDRTETGWCEWTYNEYAEIVWRLARHLHATAPSAPLIGILLPNTRWWGATFLATLACGATAVPLDIHLSASELACIVAHAGLTALVTTPAFTDTIRQLRIACPQLAAVVVIDRPEEPDAMVAQLASYATAPLPRAHLRCDTAVIIYTSGTTGTPKGVPLTHGHLLTNVFDLLAMLAIAPGERFVSILPLNHVFEILGGFVAPLALASTITYVGTLRPDVILHTMREARVTVMMVVPVFLRRFLARIKQQVRIRNGKWFDRFLWLCRGANRLGIPLGRLIFRSVRMALGPDLKAWVCGGAPINPEILRDYAALGITVLQGYGLTETSPVVAVNTIRHNRIGSVGRPIPSVEIKVVPVDGAARREGELWVRGGIVFRGYYKDAALTAAAFHNDWFRTGDLVRVDRAGYLHICGRVKNLIVTEGGKNIYPEDIETVLLQSPAIREACILGVPLGAKAEEPVAAIVPSDEFATVHGANCTKAMHAHVMTLTASMAEFKRPRRVLVLPALPLTAAQKIKRHELRSQVLAQLQQQER